MARSRHTLGHVFGRELETAERWLGGAWSSVRRVFRRSRSRPARLASVAPPRAWKPVTGAASAAPISRAPPVSPASTREETAWVLPASLLASLGAHAVVLALLLVIWIPGSGPREGAGADGETRITFLFEAGPRAVKSRPAPARIDPIPPPPPDVEPAVEDRRSPAPGDLVREDSLPEEPARGEPDGSGVDAGGRPRVEVLPLPMGLGGGTPPFPGGGGGSLRGFDSRGRGKGAALRVFGGSGATEGAVSRGLRWLADHQDEGGGWSAEGFDRHCRHQVRCAGRGMSEFDVGVTALAILAFLGAGHTPTSSPALDPLSVSPYRRNVEKALDHLLSRQDGRGAFGAVGDNYLYNHALATLAMAEAFAMTGAPRHRAALDAALSFTFAVQQSGGGWDYTSEQTGRNDLSITGWQVMALRSAELAGLTLPTEPLERLRRYLDAAVTGSGEGIYANIGQEAGRRGINMVAVGLLSRLYMGAGRDEEKVRRAAERLLRTPPDWEQSADWERTFQSYYHWYTATLALFHLGGEEWRAWNFFVARTLPELQSRKAHEAGSWPPELSWVGASGGRVYATAVNVLTLETYYRYEPLHRLKKM